MKYEGLLATISSAFWTAPCSPFVSGVENDFCSVRRKQTPSFFTHRVWHGEDKTIALDRSNYGKSNTCIPTRGFDNRISWMKTSALLCRCDHVETDAILNTSTWIYRFKLSPDCCVSISRKITQLYNRRIANEITKRLYNLAGKWHGKYTVRNLQLLWCDAIQARW